MRTKTMGPGCCTTQERGMIDRLLYRKTAHILIAIGTDTTMRELVRRIDSPHSWLLLRVRTLESEGLVSTEKGRLDNGFIGNLISLTDRGRELKSLLIKILNV